ncbi:hypothetical protein FDB15_18160 [Clostridium botulinum]|uniref:phage tail terminator family protein n=1 Tax=unclassified Clostridium TaxID=2614128 RepID=UPI000540FCAB|nr:MULTISPECIES: hypothetical protein [unclassified Clostridium]AIY78797.1 hypothetical protein U728_1661 [Clostridium botulinum 202F]KAI3344995.1 hypothetical protein CIT17_15380 [Clostridium botulinum]KON14082.1 hypothetical protein ACP50_04020 [Clostridium botulinum]MBY6986412.1 hypothetical protein [Clostridium botulinum]MBY7009056.1 hypothetical protein [Clostridium botulinum]
MNYKIKYLDLLYSVYASLKDNFKKSTITMSENKKEVKGPLFFVQIKPLYSDSYKCYTKELVNITITYTDVVLDQEKILTVKDELNELFDLGIKVNNVFLLFKNKKFSESDDCTILTLTIDYFNNKSERNIPEEDKATKLMEKLIYKEVR